MKAKEDKKIEKIKKLKMIKSKDIKKKAEHLDQLIKEKQKDKRKKEKELIQKSLKQFREMVEKTKAGDSIKPETVLKPVSFLSFKEEEESEAFATDIYEQIEDFYKHYASQSEKIKERVELIQEHKRQKCRHILSRVQSVPATDKADEIANNYIQKIRKYDSSKQLKLAKHLKNVVIKDKQFKELVKSKRVQVSQQQKSKFNGKKEEFLKNEEHAIQVSQNKAKVMCAASAKCVNFEVKFVEKQDKAIERDEGRVF